MMQSLNKAAVLLLFLLSACSMPGDSIRDGAIVGGGGAVVNSSRPMAPPLHTEQDEIDKAADPTTPIVDYNIPGIQEVHAVAFRRDCKDMLNALKKQGFQFRTYRIKSTNDPNLPYLCVLYGEDAAMGRYEDYRYNSSEEYNP